MCADSYGGYRREHADQRRGAGDEEQPEEHSVGELGDAVPLICPFGVPVPRRRPVVDGVRGPPPTARQRVSLRHVREVVNLDVLGHRAAVDDVVVVAVEDAPPKLLASGARPQERATDPGRHPLTGVLAQVDVRDDDSHEQGDGHHHHRRAEQHACNPSKSLVACTVVHRNENQKDRKLR